MNPEHIAPTDVRPADLITIPGLIDSPRMVEAVRSHDDTHTVTMVIWPEVAPGTYPEPPTEGVWNFGHWYAQFMVNVTVSKAHPIVRHTEPTEAETMARVTGSVEATFTVDRRELDGTPTPVQRQRFIR